MRPLRQYVRHCNCDLRWVRSPPCPSSFISWWSRPTGLRRGWRGTRNVLLMHPSHSPSLCREVCTEIQVSKSGGYLEGPKNAENARAHPWCYKLHIRLECPRLQMRQHHRPSFKGQSDWTRQLLFKNSVQAMLAHTPKRTFSLTAGQTPDAPRSRQGELWKLSTCKHTKLTKQPQKASLWTIHD